MDAHNAKISLDEYHFYGETTGIKMTALECAGLAFREYPNNISQSKKELFRLAISEIIFNHAEQGMSLPRDNTGTHKLISIQAILASLEVLEKIDVTDTKRIEIWRPKNLRDEITDSFDDEKDLLFHKPFLM